MRISPPNKQRNLKSDTLESAPFTGKRSYLSLSENNVFADAHSVPEY